MQSSKGKQYVEDQQVVEDLLYLSDIKDQNIVKKYELLILKRAKHDMEDDGRRNYPELFT